MSKVGHDRTSVGDVIAKGGVESRDIGGCVWHRSHLAIVDRLRLTIKRQAEATCWKSPDRASV